MNVSTHASLEKLKFDNRFVKELPGDTETGNFTRQVYGACYSKVLPKQAAKPQLVAYSKEVGELLGLSEQACMSDLFTQIFTGNHVLPGMEPYASCYGGHQFGVWAGQLGDGRAINLGDVINQKGERCALQLKGSGLTPYSRSADGLAVLRSSVREFLCSEAMYHLGVPTTRALSLTLTGEPVIRDMFYDGNPNAEPGAVVCRVAPNFIRFGHYQLPSTRSDTALLQKLVDHTVSTYFPHLSKTGVATYLSWFAEVCRLTAELMVQWERVGFVHGVMNTDNMSILGLTIDYGPYGWLENFDPDWTPNTTDARERRYRFGAQAEIAYWNLVQLANAIYPLIEDVEALQQALGLYVEVYRKDWQLTMNRKLGLTAYLPQQDDALQQQLIELLVAVETDMTLFYRKLGALDSQAIDLNNIKPDDITTHFADAYYQPAQLTAEYKQQFGLWLQAYQSRLTQEASGFAARKKRMDSVNPKYVLRNYLAQQAIDKAGQGDFSEVNTLLQVLRQPYAEQPEFDRYAVRRPEWARHRAGCSMLSCSS